jgi:hypothetical protein
MRMRVTESGASMREKRNVCWVLVEKPEGKRLLENLGADGIIILK